MMNLAEELGVQSFTFRHFKDNREVARLVKQCGLNAIELCSIHADFSDESAFDKVVSLFIEEGVRIVSIGVQGMANDERVERRYFEFVRKAGARVMSVNFSLSTVPDCFRTAEKLADEYDIKLAIHNHGGRHWLGCADTLRHVFSKTSERIGLCLDTAWALDSRESPVAMVEEFSDRLYALHIKDFVFERSGHPVDVVVGTGNLDLKALVEALKEIDFNGCAVLEYEGDVENPVPAVTKCVEAVRGVCSA